MTKKSKIKCLYCGATIPWPGRGRKPRYCRPSHRQRAYEARKRKEDRFHFASGKDLKELIRRQEEGRQRQTTLDVLAEVGLIYPRRRKAPLLKLVKKGPPEKNNNGPGGMVPPDRP